MLTLHIGTNKTGTSSVQRFLTRNREALLDQGFCYPDLDGTTAHHGVARSAKTKFTNNFTLDDNWQSELKRMLAQYPEVVLSSEAFHTAHNVESLLEFAEPGKTKVVLYIREYTPYFVSWYQQSVQSNNTAMSVAEFVEMHPVSYGALISRWQNVFGEEHVEVRHYRADLLKDSDIIADFCELVGIDQTLLEPLDRRRNLSICGNLLFAKKLLNLVITKAESLSIADEFAELAFLRPEFIGKIPVDADVVKRIEFLHRHDRAQVKDMTGIKLEKHQGDYGNGLEMVASELRSDLQLIKDHAQKNDFKLLQFAERLDGLF